MDIVAAIYPETTPPHEWKLRRCIVTDVFLDDADGSISCEISYGTSQPTSYGWPHLHIHNSSDLSAMCLSKDTRFVMGQRAIWPWTPEYFNCMYGRPTPKLGHLLPDYHREFEYCMMQYEAAQQDKAEQKDIAG
ncbi:hypothetical protein D1012_18780 [Pseudotabrizicola alkalilacus]|uniref:Uncharacterized protein n=1 Tax=Pseudotabrizicola alkalilacus TaxID=2305252 RepID=A0A411YY22_9RHOB|nr:hypothetical protein D1012_18780 [Pseudotabrizicola alkalilacus]